jgi:hypothetical protein
MKKVIGLSLLVAAAGAASAAAAPASPVDQVSPASGPTHVVRLNNPVPLSGRPVLNRSGGSTRTNPTTLYDNLPDEAFNGFSSGPQPRRALDDFNFPASLSTGALITEFSWGFVANTQANDVDAVVVFYNTLTPANSPVNTDPVGAFRVTLHDPTGIWTAGAHRVVVNLSTLPGGGIDFPDGGGAVDIIYIQTGSTYPPPVLDTHLTAFFKGDADPAVGTSDDVYWRDADANGQYDTGDARTFTGDGNFANFAMKMIGKPHTPPVATGRCCVGSACSVMSQADCTAASGSYGGDNTDCGSPTFTQASCNNPLEDISTTGTPVTLTAGNGDDGVMADAPIGFSFSFMGVPHTTTTIGTNGFLTFGTQFGGNFGAGNGLIPSTSAPNDLIAPLWNDWDSSVGGDIRYQTLGAAGSRRFIVQWTNVPVFGRTDQNTFQVVLFEQGNRIEFHYTNLSAPDSGADYTIGIEDATGRVGVSEDPTFVGFNSCFGYTTQGPAPVCTNPCPVDITGDGQVNVGDFLAFLQLFAAGNLRADMTGDGQVNVQDFLRFLQLFSVGC